MMRMVTRTIEETKVTYLTIDAEGQKVIELDCTLPGKYAKDEKLTKTLRKMGIEFVRIVSAVTSIKRYGCTESEFLAIAKEVPLLKKGLSENLTDEEEVE